MAINFHHDADSATAWVRLHDQVCVEERYYALSYIVSCIEELGITSVILDTSDMDHSNAEYANACIVPYVRQAAPVLRRARFDFFKFHGDSDFAVTDALRALGVEVQIHYNTSRLVEMT